MRAVVQRVTEASVAVDGVRVASIGRGLLVLVGVGRDDGAADVEWIAEKIAPLRIFADEAGQMNLSVQDVKGELLLVSQFTLHGDCRRGRRPSYSDAARPEDAQLLYEDLLARLKTMGLPVQAGVFRAMMQVALVNDGPVTLLLDSKKVF
jgi:D-tyrosyl-tRNA(Tyr) deacylase